MAHNVPKKRYVTRMKLHDGVSPSPLSSDEAASNISSPQRVPSIGSPLSLDFDFLGSPSDKLLTSQTTFDILGSSDPTTESELCMLTDHTLSKEKLKGSSSSSSTCGASSSAFSINSPRQQDSPYKTLLSESESVSGLTFDSDSPRPCGALPGFSQVHSDQRTDTPNMRESYEANNSATTAMEHPRPSSYGRMGGKLSRGMVAGTMMPHFSPSVGYGEDSAHSSQNVSCHTSMDYTEGGQQYDSLPQFTRESHTFTNGSSNSSHSSNYNGHSSSTSLGPHDDLAFPCSPLLDALMGKFNDDYMVTDKSWTPQRHLSAPAACDASDSLPEFSYTAGGETPDVFGDQAPGYPKPVKHSKRGYSLDIQIKQEVDDSVMNSCSVTTSGRNKGCGKSSDPKFDCQICGDIAAGFHCGAFVCEACKKFYLRCLKNGSNLSYTCPKDKNCIITKETRSHCQFCRFQKCVDLGMYKPGRDDSKLLKVDFKAIACKVCSAPSSGFHFGAITCEGCKGFYRRMVKERLHNKFVCGNGGNCAITSSNRTSCKICRFNKCQAVGMTLEGTRLGRQSNIIKLSTLEEHNMKRKLKNMKEIPAEMPRTHSSSMDSSLFSGDTSDTEELMDEGQELKSSPLSVTSHSRLSDSTPPFATPGDTPPWGRGPPFNGQNHSHSDPPSVSSRRGSDAASRRDTFSDRTTRSKGAAVKCSRSSGSVNSRHSPPPNEAMESMALVPSKKSSKRHSVDSNISSQSASDGDRMKRPPAGIGDPPMGGPPGGFPPGGPPGGFPPGGRPGGFPPGGPPGGFPPGGPPGGPPMMGFPPPGSTEPCNIKLDLEVFKDPSGILDELLGAYKLLSGILQRPAQMDKMELKHGDLNAIWDIASSSFKHHAKVIIKYTKKLPVFRQLPILDQVAMVQDSLYPISLLLHSKNYDMETGDHDWFVNTQEEKDFVIHYFPLFAGLGKHFKHTGYIFKSLKLTDEEFALLCALCVFTPDGQMLTARNQVSLVQEEVMAILAYHCRKNCNEARISELLPRMSELRRCNIEHIRIAMESQKDHPDVDFGKLWQEIFFSREEGPAFT